MANAHENEGSPVTGARERYRHCLSEIESRRSRLKGVDRLWNRVRLGLFVAAAGLIVFGHLLVPNRVVAAVGWACVPLFLCAISYHQRVRDDLASIRRGRAVLRRLLARLDRKWDRLPLWTPPPAWLRQSEAGGVSAEAVADDLDVFGRGSLFQFVSMASTGPGLRTLATWIIGPALPDAARRRHQAALLMAPLWSWRQRFYALSRRAAEASANPDRFLQWIHRPSWLAGHRWLGGWSWVSPFLSAALIVLLGFSLSLGVSDAVLRLWGYSLATIIVVNVLVSTFLLGPVHEIFAAALAGRGDVDGYRELFAMAAELPSDPNPDRSIGEPSLVSSAQQALGDPDRGAVSAMRSLGHIAWLASIKQSGILFPIYLLLQMLGLYDLHVLRRLEVWQVSHADRADRWFESLGELEASASIAGLVDEYPDWASPRWSDEIVLVEAERLGHPLLRDDARVCNDVTVGPQGTLLLVTGSNMSGKSTLLRGLGLNVLLAGAGGPVCAASMSLPALELATSIRVRDNLGEGVSFYMAELHSLARVVDRARSLAIENAGVRSAVDHDGSSTASRGPTLMFLLDEILQGTNSRERQIAVAHVLKHLLDRGAIGAISTHDLDLADDPALQKVAQTVHFRETITPDAGGRDRMTFDYVMRQGVSPTTNALKLLEVVGLGIEDPIRA